MAWKAAGTHFEGVTTVRFPVDHLHDLFMHRLSGLVPIAPVVACPNTALADVEVLGVVNVAIRARLYPMDNLR
jgi:hypothetical protein